MAAPSPDWTERFRQWLCRTESQVLTVMLGSNDLLQRPGLQAEIVKDRMERFLTALFTKVPPSLKVLLVAPPPMSPGAWVPDKRLIEESRKLADCYKTLAQRLGIHFADAGAWDIDLWDIDLAFDGVHFSELGHRVFAEELQKTLKQIIPLK